MEHPDQAQQPPSPRQSVEQESGDQPPSGDGALVRHPACHRYEIAYLLSLRSLPASQKPPEGSSQLNSAMRWANSNRRSDSGFKSESGQGSLLGMPAHLRAAAQPPKNALKSSPAANNASSQPPAATAPSSEQQPSSDQQAPAAPAVAAAVAAPPAAPQDEEQFRPRPAAATEQIFAAQDATSFLPQSSKFVDDELKQIGKSQLGLHFAGGFPWPQGADARQAPPPHQSLPNVRRSGASVAFGGYAPPPRMMGGLEMGMGGRPGFDRAPGVGMVGIGSEQYYTATGPEAGQWEPDPWDSPVDQGDVNDIFTLGDIRQAEHTIETQGISAESYANFRTRKILNEQAADRNRRPANQPAASDTSGFTAPNKGMSPDIFFGDGRPPAMGGDRVPPGESRFLSMFNENAQSAAAHDQRAPTPRTMTTTTREQLQNQAISALQSLPYAQQQQLAANWMAQQAENKSAGEKAQMREHLLKLLGLKQQHTPQVASGHYPGNAPGGFRPSNAPFAAAPRPPGMTFSKPLNPAAPNFAPSGLYNPAVNNDPQQHLKRGNGANMAPPSMDYRRGQMGFEHSPNHHLTAGQTPHYPPAGVPAWNQRVPHIHSPPVDEYGNQMGQHPQQQPMGPQQPAGNITPDIQELIQKLLARHKMPNQHQVPDQHLTGSQQALQRSLNTSGHLPQDQMQLVLNYLRNSKQFQMSAGAAAAGQNARRNTAVPQQQKVDSAVNMMQQNRQQSGGGYPAPPGVGGGAHPQAAALQPQLAQATLAQLLSNPNLLQQVGASPHGSGGARGGGAQRTDNQQKVMTALLQLTKVPQQRVQTPGGAPSAAIPTGGGKHIQLSNCLDQQLQGGQNLQQQKKQATNAAAQNRQTAAGGGATAAAAFNLQQAAARARQQQQHGPPFNAANNNSTSSAVAEHDAAATTSAAPGAAGGKVDQMALNHLLRSLAPSHPLWSQLQQLIRQREQIDRVQAEQRHTATAETFLATAAAAAAAPSVAPSTVPSSNNGTAAPTATTTSATHQSSSSSINCENKENGSGSQLAATENCSSPPTTTTAPPAKDEGVEQNEHSSPRQVSAADE